MKSDVKSTRL